MHINRQIELFLKDHNMPPTKFGRMAAHDPRLVFDIRMGRELRPETKQKLELFITDFPQRMNVTGPSL
jgi:hypothetical protein